jgi:hypothetical protein
MAASSIHVVSDATTQARAARFLTKLPMKNPGSKVETGPGQTRAHHHRAANAFASGRAPGGAEQKEGEA